jgi:hypothetical protein
MKFIFLTRHLDGRAMSPFFGWGQGQNRFLFREKNVGIPNDQDADKIFNFPIKKKCFGSSESRKAFFETHVLPNRQGACRFTFLTAG